MLASPSATIVRGRGWRDSAFRAGHCGKGGRCSIGCHLSNSGCCGLVFGGGLRGGRAPEGVTESQLADSLPSPGFSESPAGVRRPRQERPGACGAEASG
ncbi:hypothetical protein MDA_GLEAN10008925 [Myotis davidii]|uniref:Uncharacterized protein n=1 Tax=Myotis davidii TaxID=225400 RepID=L5M787_MYODS|nr:hypothetical protein MDA_GLEAN10008925 [Myotis davidii]